MAHGEGAPDGVTHEGGAGGLALALEGGQQAEGVFPTVVLLGLTGNLPHGIVQIGQAGEGVGLLTRLDALWPAGYERYAMSSLVDVGLVTPVPGARVVTEFFELGEIPFGGTSVVAGEENEGVVVYACLLDRGQEFAHMSVRLHHEVRVGVHLAGSFVGRDGHDRGMRSGQGQVKKEGFLGFGPFLDVGDAFLEEMGQDLVDMEIGTYWPLAVPTVRVLVAVHAFLAVGEGSDLAGIHPSVGRHVERSAMAVVAVEAIDVRTILHRFGKVDVLPFAFLFVYAGPVPAQMPLSDHLSVVSGLLEKVGDGCPLGGDQVVARSAQDATGQAGSPIVASGQNAVPGGRADGA